MISSTAINKGMNRPMPDMGDVVFATNIAINVLAALSNHVSALSPGVAATAAPYVAVTAPAITRKSSGIFLIWSAFTVAVNGGNMVDADAVGIQLSTGAVAGAGLLNPLLTSGASTTTGGPAGGLVAVSFDVPLIHNPGIAPGAPIVYSAQVVNCNGAPGHTSGILANEGIIIVLELPG